MWNLPAPPGFRGLDPYLPVTKYDRFLPHWRQAGATYFVTFRLADALPRSRIEQLRRFRQEWEQQNPVPRSDDQDRELARELMRRVEHWLDQGAGSCVLRNPTISAIVTESLHYFDQSRYELGCYVVMPNHVHAVVRPLQPEVHPVEELIGGWKKHSSLEINRLLHRSGALWQEESFDPHYPR